MKFLAVVVLALTIPPVASAQTTTRAELPAISTSQVLTIVNQANVPADKLRDAQWEVGRQVVQARQWWPQMPTIRFGRGGWPITLVHGSPLAACGGEADGCHSVSVIPGVGFGTPWAIVGTAHSAAEDPNEAWESALSHEILEMLSNPDTLLFGGGTYPDLEICDLAEGYDYEHSGVWLEDYALPEAYTANPHGRVDYMRAVTARDVRGDFSYEGVPPGSIQTGL